MVNLTWVLFSSYVICYLLTNVQSSNTKITTQFSKYIRSPTNYRSRKSLEDKSSKLEDLQYLDGEIPEIKMINITNPSDSVNSPKKISDDNEKQNKQCFVSRQELLNAVRIYIAKDLSSPAYNKTLKKYGYPIGKWCVGQIQDMSGIFEDQVQFTGINDHDISTWNTSSATSMRNMFSNCTSLSSAQINSWDTSRVKDMSGMFNNALKFNDDLSVWDTLSVVNMSAMFRNAISFNSLIFSSVGSVLDMTSMFENSSQFDDPSGVMSTWDTSRVKSMKAMFKNAVSFNSNSVKKWDVSSLAYGSEMFAGAVSFNQDIKSWDVRSLIDLSMMFDGAKKFKQNLCSWGDKLLTNYKTFDGKSDLLYNAFKGTECPNPNFSGLTVVLDQDVITPLCYICSVENPNNPEIVLEIVPTEGQEIVLPEGKKTSSQCFDNELELKEAINVYISSDSNTLEFKELAQSYGTPIGSWCVGKITNMAELFSGQDTFTGIGDHDISNWDTSSAVTMKNMFSGCSLFNGYNLGRWNTSKVLDMSGMFRDAILFNEDLTNLDTSSVVNMSAMFYNASSFNNGIFKSVGNVSDMSHMFEKATEFNDVNKEMTRWDTSLVKTMSCMFKDATSFDSDSIIYWDVSSVVDVREMFSRASLFNQDIKNWNVSSVINAPMMFADAKKFSQNLCLWGENMIPNYIQGDKNSLVLDDMFTGSSCPHTSNTGVVNILNQDVLTPMCFLCNVEVPSV